MRTRMFTLAAAALLALPLAGPSFAADKGSGIYAQDNPVVTTANPAPQITYAGCADKSLRTADIKAPAPIDNFSLALKVRGNLKRHGLNTTLVDGRPGPFIAPATGDGGSAHLASSLAKDMSFVTNDGTVMTVVQLAAAWDAALADLSMRGPQTQ